MYKAWIWIPGKNSVKFWTGFNCLNTGFPGMLLWTWWTFGFHESRYFFDSWVTVNCSRKTVTINYLRLSQGQILLRGFISHRCLFILALSLEMPILLRWNCPVCTIFLYTLQYCVSFKSQQNCLLLLSLETNNW